VSRRTDGPERDEYRSAHALAKATLQGTLELLTAAWERSLGYGREEITGKRLSTLLLSAGPAAVVAAILDERSADPVELTLRCRDGDTKQFRLHRRFDDYSPAVFIVAEERHAA
jgi:PAS domain-containing protein